MASGARRSRRRGGGSSAAAMTSPIAASQPSSINLLSPGGRKPSDVSELRSWLSSRMEGLSSGTDQVHSGISKEIESANARFKKRLKFEIDAAARHLEEANRAWKAFSTDVEEDIQEIQAVSKELVSKIQLPSSKTSFSELQKSVENQIDNLRTKYVRGYNT